MVKKKQTETEDKTKTTDTKPAEYKDDTSKDTEDKKEEKESSSEDKSTGQPLKVEPDEAPAPDKVVSEVEVLKEKVAELQDKYLRLSAEFDNYRKRTLKEKMDSSKYASEELLKKILPLMDDFERALKHMETSTNGTGIKEGVDLIYTKFSEFLKQQDVREIESLNLDFNVDLHDAIAKIPVTEEEKKGKVVDVVQKGYYLKDKIIRHSKVVVGE